MNEINKTFLSNDIVFSLIVLSAAVLTGVILYFISMLMVKKWKKARSSNKLKWSPDQFKGPIFSLSLSLGVMFVLPVLRFPKGVLYTVSHIVNPWFIASIGWMLIRIVGTAKELLLSRYDITAKDNLRARRVYTQTRVIEGIVNVVIIVVTFSLLLMTFEKVRQVGTSLLASASIIGVILGFAAQKTLGNLINRSDLL